jgi:cell wall-associated NlpC family hydrolase
MKKALLIFSFIFLIASQSKAQNKQAEQTLSDQYKEKLSSIITSIPEATGNKVSQVMDFAKSLLGIRYRYASSNPSKGFDCSGFVSYVFKQFGFDTNGARSSSDFAAKGKTVALADAKVGDVLVFTGTNSKIRRAGHVGIIYSKDEDGNIKFIHSSSGKAKGVTITALEGYYKNRLLKAVTVME